MIRENGQTIYLQLKRSTEAVGYGARGLARTQAWVRKALADLGTTDYQRVRYVLPGGVSLPPQVAKWFGSAGINIATMRVPHL